MTSALPAWNGRRTPVQEVNCPVQSVWNKERKRGDREDRDDREREQQFLSNPAVLHRFLKPSDGDTAAGPYLRVFYGRGETDGCLR